MRDEKYGTHPGDLVLLVTDKDNPFFGQIAKIELHDYRDSGDYFVTMIDGRRERFYDGILKGDSNPGIRVFYRHNDEKGKYLDKKEEFGPNSLKKAFLSLNVGNLKILSERYQKLFKENL